MRDDPELDNILFSPVDMILEDSLGTEAGHAGYGLGKAELEVIVKVEDGQEVGLILTVERDIAVIADAFNGCATKFRNESVIKSGGEPVLIKEDLRFFFADPPRLNQVFL